MPNPAAPRGCTRETHGLRPCAVRSRRTSRASMGCEPAPEHLRRGRRRVRLHDLTGQQRAHPHVGCEHRVQASKSRVTIASRSRRGDRRSRRASCSRPWHPSDPAARLPPRRSEVQSMPESCEPPHVPSCDARGRSSAMTATDTPVDNGVNVEALLGAREALTATPEAASFQLACDVRMAERHPQQLRRRGLLRPRRRAAATAPNSRSTPITPRSSRRKTTARRRSSMCSSGSPAA